MKTVIYIFKINNEDEESLEPVAMLVDGEACIHLCDGYTARLEEKDDDFVPHIIKSL